ncbi:MAG: dihydroorotate dehydrogenase-like protein, partial [Chitinivibrionales bacterium]|nr:dihydroorotate dehydrogenase-like protein [Chitinivibrionales bacterium]
YLEHIARLKSRVSIPIIGSLNGTSPGGWTQYAADMERAGADALELNLYFLTADPDVSGAEIERHCVEVVSDVKQRVRIPVAVKLSPFFSSIPNMATRLQAAGADALVIFNRFYQPDIDPDTMTVTPDLRLSSSDELRLRLRWAGLLSGRVDIDLALTGGVHSTLDAVKVLMAGGAVAMMTSALLLHGAGHMRTVRDGIAAWLDNRSYESVESVRGVMSQRHIAEPAAYERANYIEVLGSYQPRVQDQLSVESHR